MAGKNEEGRKENLRTPLLPRRMNGLRGDARKILVTWNVTWEISVEGCLFFRDTVRLSFAGRVVSAGSGIVACQPRTGRIIYLFLCFVFPSPASSAGGHSVAMAEK